MANVTMGLLAQKLGMTQIFDESGEAIPVTVLTCGPNTVYQVKTSDGPDGYDALQIGFGTRKPTRTNKPLDGHAAKAGAPAAKHLVEIRVPADVAKAQQAGATLTVGALFAAGELVDVIGTSKGRGFAGVMKRHHFKGSLTWSHGTHEYFRHGGSIGTRLTPGMTLAGKKMPGQMGNERVTVQNIRVARVDAEQNLLFIRGGVPGPNGTTVLIRKSTKAAARAAQKAKKGK